MKARHLVGIAVAALAIALTKVWLSQPGPELPAAGAGPVNFDSLYPAEADAALKAKAQPPAR